MEDQDPYRMLNTARVRLRPPGDRDDQATGVAGPAEDPQWQRLPLLPASTCQHQQTMCDDCIDSWANDWEVMIDRVSI